MKYDVAVFNLFGTLVDACFSFQEHEHMLSKMSETLSAPLKEFTALWKETGDKRDTGKFSTVETNIEHICKSLSISIKEEQIKNAAQIRHDFIRCILTPRPDAIEILTKLKEFGFKTGVISNCSPEVPVLWKDTPLPSLVDHAVFSCIAGAKKPDKKIYNLFCDQINVKPKTCLYLGDGNGHELTGATKVGMHPVLLRLSAEDTYDAPRPDAKEWKGPTISSLNEILNLLE